MPMRYYVDKRTFAGLTNGNSTTYTHGLNGVPDSCAIRYLATLAAGPTFSVGGLCALYDASTVTLKNAGITTLPDFEVVTMRFHSLIQ